MHLFLVRQPLAEQVADARARTVDNAIRTRVPVSIEERASLVPRRKFIALVLSGIARPARVLKRALCTPDRASCNALVRRHCPHFCRLMQVAVEQTFAD